ncbi:Homeodomain-like protein [Poronia punctata]|nr:Homeodomain-like protein [Poronia punctata]
MVEEEQRRGPWAQHEDEILMRLVQQHGPFHWVDISKALRTRSPKQCRERYHQNLKPSLNHEPISAEEGELIDQLVQQLGKRWAEIARRLNNRSDNAVKNWWNGSMNRRKRMSRRKGSASSEDNYPRHQGPPRLVTESPWHPAYSSYEPFFSPSSRRFSHPTWSAHPSGLPSPTAVSPVADTYAPDSCHPLYLNATATRPASRAFSSDVTHPLRSLRRESATSICEPGQGHRILPSITPGGGNDTVLLPPIRTAAEARSQLPTAPNSPLELPSRPATRHNQHHHHNRHHRHPSSSNRSQDDDPSDGPSAKMKLSNILG